MGQRVIKGSYSILIFSRVFFGQDEQVWKFGPISSNYFNICWYYTHKKVSHSKSFEINWFSNEHIMYLEKYSLCSWYKYSNLSFTANFHCCWHTSNISESRDRERTSRETPPHPHSPMESHRYVTHSLALPRDTCCAICRLRAPRASLYNVKKVHCTLPSVILHSWWATDATETPRLTQTL